MRIGVVSDIHGNFAGLTRAVVAMGRIDALLHAGDGYHEVSVWRRENQRIRVEMVQGNCDLHADCAEEAVFTFDSWRVLLTHGHRYGVKTDRHRLLARAQEVGVQLVVYGHTHRPEQVEVDGIMLLNPGCLCPSRSYGRLSYGLVETAPDKLQVRLEYL